MSTDQFDKNRVKPHYGKFVFYLRGGSRSEVGEQRQSIFKALDYDLRDDQILKEYIEPHSSNPHQMPQLELAIKYAIHRKADIIASKIGPRIYNLKFVSLMLDAHVKHGLRFAAIDIYGAHWVDLGLLGGIVEMNRKRVSINTKKAMAKLKAEGVRLGSPNIEKATRQATIAHTIQANEFAVSMRPVINEIKQHGARTFKDIAIALNKRGIKSRYGRSWHPSSVRNLTIKLGDLT